MRYEEKAALQDSNKARIFEQQQKKVKIRFGLRDDNQAEIFKFKTDSEVSAFYKGLDAAIGYMEYEEIEINEQRETININYIGMGCSVWVSIL